MSYSDIIRRSFRSLKTGGLWGLAASTQAVRVVLLLAVLAAVNAFGESGVTRLIVTVVPWRATNAVVVQVGYFAAVMIALILSIPINLILQGGLTHLSDEVLSGRPARTADGWSEGARQMGKVFAIRLVVGLVVFVASMVCAIPFILAIFSLVFAGAARGAAAPAFVGACCGYLVFLVLIVFLALFGSAYGEIAVRYGVIGRRGAGDALSSAWKALRARWKNVFVFALIQIGFGLVWVAITAVVAIPLEFALGAGQRLPTLSHLLGGYAISGPVTIALMLPLVVFSYSMWTGFFRQMTGLDVAPAPLGYADPGMPLQPAPYPPYPPSAPSGPPMANMPATPTPGVDGTSSVGAPQGSGSDTSSGGHDVPAGPA